MTAPRPRPRAPIGQRIAALRDRLFARPASPPPAPGPGDLGPDTAEDWQPGDLAECLHPGCWTSRELGLNDIGPRHTECLVVTRVEFVEFEGLTFLGFARWPRFLFAARHFRKITPRADEAKVWCAETADFDYRRHIPARIPEPAGMERAARTSAQVTSKDSEG